MTPLQTIFLLGKGGTGKSTASALLSLELSEKKKKVLLASFDDAHNLGDIFEQHFSHTPCRIHPFLDVLQVDKDREIRHYLDYTTRKVKQSYTYLTAFNLDNYFDVLKYAPGMEAHALATAFTALRKRYATHDYLVIDMPPTALAMNFFNLPSLSLVWAEQLEGLRMEINRRKEIVSRIKFAGKKIERDKTLVRIQEIKSDYQAIQACFRDPAQSRFLAVHNGDRLSVAETDRIIRQLNPMNIRPAGLIYNHRSPDGPGEKSIPRSFQSIPAMTLPCSPFPLIGQPALARYADSLGVTFTGLFGR